ncbi:MAG: M20/M25/M40 family metallo-hydrolase [Persicimonas sp.]
MTTDKNDDLAALLETWLEIDSTTGHEAAFLAALEAYFGDLGFDCARQPVGKDRWNLLVSRTDDPTLLYSTHVDTVPPYFGPCREGDTIYGRGACDTKGGIVAMAQAGRRLLADGHTDFGYLFVVGEEVDHIGAKISRNLELAPERIILCEPTRNRVVAAQKGMLKLGLSASGRAGHSAYPDRGVSAVHRLLDAVEALRNEPWPVDDLLGPTTLNVGVIEGGVAANVFAPSARAEVLFRTVSDTEALLERVRELMGEHIDEEQVVYNDPVFFEPPEGVETCTVPFNTDATYLSELGPIWLVGPGDIEHAHSDAEHITLESLRAGVDLYEELGRSVLEAV